MKRKDLQRLTTVRLKEAGLLLKAKSPEGAYYLAGYAAECAIKACIAKRTERYDFPELKRVTDSWTHDLNKLMLIAGLKDALKETEKQQPELNARWQVVRKWSEKSRYEVHSYLDAEGFLDALQNPKL